jgi:pSer/pThr/pTyr-binding forkhead associated (FHA) protein
MHDLEITWPAGQARFSPDDSPVQIGRSPDAAIILTEPSVSRRHIEFVWNGTAWTANDFSTHGSLRAGPSASTPPSASAASRGSSSASSS